MINSPNGCKDCDYCFCLFPEENEQYQQCATIFELKFLQCVEQCEHIEVCLPECNQDYYDNLKLCPCQEYCPEGCPCDGFDCDLLTQNHTTTSISLTTTTQSEIKTTSSTTSSTTVVYQIESEQYFTLESICQLCIVVFYPLLCHITL